MPFRSCRALVRAGVLTLAFAAFAATSFVPQHAALAAPSDPQARRPLILIPGLLGSRLCRPATDDASEPEVVWGTLGALSGFPSLRLEEGGPDNGIEPCGLIREIVYLGIFTQEFYGPVIEHLEALGYEEEKDLFTFDYDWRLSVFDNAERLAAFVDEKVPGRSERVDIVAHSMGGLIARVYVVEHGGAERLGRLITAGTPFQGSVKVFETLEKGWGAMNVLFGGIETFRRTILSFPSTFELMPRYEGCCDAGGGVVSTFGSSGVEPWLALGWQGVDEKSLPDLGAARERQRRLQEIVDAGLPQGVPDIMFIGVDQRTPQQFALESDDGRAEVRLVTTWAGDGTVVKDSAVIPGAVVHPTSFADHQHILGDDQVQEFLGLVLTEGLDEAVRSVPVRPRSRVRTALGQLTELIGVAVVADQPLYRTRQIARVTVHMRPGDRDALSTEAIRVTVHRPDGTDSAVALRPDPSASDPSNPFEQSFTGSFDTGTSPGEIVVTAEVSVEAPEPRVVTHTFGVIEP